MRNSPWPFLAMSILVSVPAAADPPAPSGHPGSAAPHLDVASPAHAGLLAVHDVAPTFHAVTHDGHRVDVTPAARPRPLVVYFYPRDETPGCTIEAQGFRDAHQDYESAGVDVVGVSTDPPTAHEAFASHQGLNFGLISDPDGRLAAAFGVEVHGGYAQRVTFVIDRTGHIARVFPRVDPNGHAAEVIAAARGR